MSAGLYRKRVSSSARHGFAVRKAKELLGRAGIVCAPVPVESLAVLSGAEVRYEPCTEAVSGMLLRRGKLFTIGINQAYPKEQQRFVIAHEIGHLILHPEEEFHFDDCSSLRIRGLKSSVVDIEANCFASEVLMPTQLVAKDVIKYTGRSLETAVMLLSRKYGVTRFLMAVRLSSLGHV